MGILVYMALECHKQQNKHFALEWQIHKNLMTSMWCPVFAQFYNFYTVFGGHDAQRNLNEI